MRNPVVSDSEVYEIKRLRWEELTPNEFWAKKPDGNLIRVRKLLWLGTENGEGWDASSTDKIYPSKKMAMEAAEKAYRQQLRKALRRVRR